MPHTHSHKPGDDALRTARIAILGNRPIPARVEAALEARNIDVHELTERLLAQQEFRS